MEMACQRGEQPTGDSGTREEARRAVLKLKTRIGTHMSGWLLLAHRTFQSCPATLRHAILLTDGENLERPGRIPITGTP